MTQRRKHLSHALISKGKCYSWEEALHEHSYGSDKGNSYTWFTFQKAHRVCAVKITSPLQEEKKKKKLHLPPTLFPTSRGGGGVGGASLESRGFWSFLPWIGCVLSRCVC